jgi:hypothetical protein
MRQCLASSFEEDAMAKKPTPTPTDPVAALRQKTALVEAAIAERDALLGEQLHLEGAGVEPDVSGLKTMETLTHAGLLNGSCPPGVQGGLKLAYIIGRRETLAREIERGRAEEETLRYAAAPLVGEAELQEWKRASTELLALATALARQQDQLRNIRDRFLQKTGAAGMLAFEDALLSRDPLGAMAVIDAVAGFAESGRRRGNSDFVTAKPTEREELPAMRRRPFGADIIETF